MNRRELITLAGGVAAWPVVARAQKAAVPVVGLLGIQPIAGQMNAIRQGLREAGFDPGRDALIEYRGADGNYDRLPALAAELVNMKVAVVAATGTSAPARAAMAATTTIPIVFQTGGDPVRDGLVTSLNRPTGNVTGATRITRELAPKRLELLRAMASGATSIAMLVRTDNPISNQQVSETREPAKALGLDLQVFGVRGDDDFQSAFAAMTQKGLRALIIANEPSFTNHVDEIAALAIRHSIATMCTVRLYVAGGILMSYDSDIEDSYRQVGVYTGRILRGTKPSDLPVQQPTRFALTINRKTAGALALEISPQLLALADEVIE